MRTLRASFVDKNIETFSSHNFLEDQFNVDLFLHFARHFIQMKYILPLLFISSMLQAQPSGEEKKVLGVVQQFFDALEKQDTVSFRNMFLDGARNYAAREVQDSVVVRGFLAKDFRFKP